MTGFMLTGETQTRVFDFVRVMHAIRLEQKGLKNGQGSALTAATQKGYVPRELVSRGNVQRRREAAIEYMGYVTKLLTTGGTSRQFGEEIVTGKVTYSGMDDCGCPSYLGTPDSAFYNTPDVGTMCIHPKQDD